MRVLRLVRLYIVDWLLIGAVLLLILFVQIFVPPTERVFFIDDPSIRYPHSDETVPSYVVPWISSVFPAVAIASPLFLRVRTKEHVFVALLGLALAQTLTLAITDFFKYSAGRLRPDFLSRCVPKMVESVLVCTGDKIKVHNGRLSFPSGHASHSFSGLGYLAIYMMANLKIFSEKGSVWRMFLCTLPLFAAAFVAVSRIFDYRHHSHDVAAGSFIGIFCAYVCYRQYFPSLLSPNARISDDVRSQREIYAVRSTVSEKNDSLV